MPGTLPVSIVIRCTNRNSEAVATERHSTTRTIPQCLTVDIATELNPIAGTHAVTWAVLGERHGIGSRCIREIEASAVE